MQITERKNLVKLRKGDVLDGDNDVKDNLPSHLGSFILSNSKKILNNFIMEKTVFAILMFTVPNAIPYILIEILEMC